MTPCLKQHYDDEVVTLPYDPQEALRLELAVKSREVSITEDDGVKGLLALSNIGSKRSFESISMDQDNIIQIDENLKKKQKCVRFSPSTKFDKEKPTNVLTPNHAFSNVLYNKFIRMAKQCPQQVFRFCESKGFLKKAALPNGQMGYMVVAPIFLPYSLALIAQQRQQNFHNPNFDSDAPRSPCSNPPCSNPPPKFTFLDCAEVCNSIRPAGLNNEMDDTPGNSPTEDHQALRPSSTQLSDLALQGESDSSPKVSNPSIYLCREFTSLRANRTSTFNQPPVAVDEKFSLGMRRMLTQEEIFMVARQFFGDVQANKWEEELRHATAHSLQAQNAYLKHNGHYIKNPRVKLIFQLIQCSDFFYSDRCSQEFLDQSMSCFVKDFENSLLRVLIPSDEEDRADQCIANVDLEGEGSTNQGSDHLNTAKNKKYLKFNKFRQGSVRFRNQEALLSTLPLVYFCVSHLIENHGMALEYNLCQFLLLASCLEGRGVYHYRASNNLSAAHKAYRYMIERIGGKDFSSKNFDSCDRAEKELRRTFENNTT